MELEFLSSCQKTSPERMCNWSTESLSGTGSLLSRHVPCHRIELDAWSWLEESHLLQIVRLEKDALSQLRGFAIAALASQWPLSWIRTVLSLCPFEAFCRTFESPSVAMSDSAIDSCRLFAEPVEEALVTFHLDRSTGLESGRQRSAQVLSTLGLDSTKGASRRGLEV